MCGCGKKESLLRKQVCVHSYSKLKTRHTQSSFNEKRQKCKTKPRRSNPHRPTNYIQLHNPISSFNSLSSSAFTPCTSSKIDKLLSLLHRLSKCYFSNLLMSHLTQFPSSILFNKWTYSIFNTAQLPAVFHLHFYESKRTRPSKLHLSSVQFPSILARAIIK
jgi:hypothetical protein